MWDESPTSADLPAARKASTMDGETSASIVGAWPQTLGGFLRHLNAASQRPAAVIDRCADQSCAWRTQGRTEFTFLQVFPAFFVSPVAVTGTPREGARWRSRTFHCFISQLHSFTFSTLFEKLYKDLNTAVRKVKVHSINILI